MLQCQGSAAEQTFPLSREEVSSLRYVSTVASWPHLSPPCPACPPESHAVCPAVSVHALAPPVPAGGRACEQGLVQSRERRPCFGRELLTGHLQCIRQASFSLRAGSAHNTACFPQRFSRFLRSPSRRCALPGGNGLPDFSSLPGPGERSLRRRFSGTPTPSSPWDPRLAPLFYFVTGKWPVGRLTPSPQHPWVQNECRLSGRRLRVSERLPWPQVLLAGQGDLLSGEVAGPCPLARAIPSPA